MSPGSSGVKKILVWTAVAAFAFVVFVKLLPDEPDDSANQNAAIAVVKSSHTPSVQFLSWNPDIDDMQWIATRCGSVCSNTDTDCYLVSASVDVITLGEKKTLRPEWIVCAGNTKYQPFNTEAKILFVTR
jgi:hypothetical protein